MNVGRDAGDFAASTGEVDEALLARYVRAYEEANVDALVALFHEDVTTSMPPYATWISGLEASGEFYRQMLARGPSDVGIVRTRANGTTALAFYRADGPGLVRTLRAIQLVGMRQGKVASIDHFVNPSLGRVFGLPYIL